MSDPLTGSVICFSASRTLSRVAVTSVLPLDLSGHHVLDIEPLDCQHYPGLEFLARRRAPGAQPLLDSLLRGDAHLLEKLAHRHVEVVAHRGLLSYESSA